MQAKTELVICNLQILWSLVFVRGSCNELTIVYWLYVHGYVCHYAVYVWPYVRASCIPISFHTWQVQLCNIYSWIISTKWVCIISGYRNNRTDCRNHLIPGSMERHVSLGERASPFWTQAGNFITNAPTYIEFNDSINHHSGQQLNVGLVLALMSCTI